MKKMKKSEKLINIPGVSKYSLISSSLSAVCAMIKKIQIIYLIDLKKEKRVCKNHSCGITQVQLKTYPKLKNMIEITCIRSYKLSLHKTFTYSLLAIYMRKVT